QSRNRPIKFIRVTWRNAPLSRDLRIAVKLFVLGELQGNASQDSICGAFRCFGYGAFLDIPHRLWMGIFVAQQADWRAGKRRIAVKTSLHFLKSVWPGKTGRCIIKETRSENPIMAEDAAELGGRESARHYYFNSTDDRGLRSSYVKRTLSRDSS